MRKLLLLAAAAGILGMESATAQALRNAAAQNFSPDIDSLRRVLKLSPHLQLKWTTSLNGVDRISVTDNFNRSNIGPDWNYESGFWQILNGELDVTAAADNEWRYLAVFQPVYNTPERKIESVSYRWGRNADELGIREAAHALMIDSPDYAGSGYWLWHRTNWFEVWLWIIKNGTWEYTPGEGKEVDRVPAQLTSNPVAGDVITAYIRNEPDAVYFDYYVNGYLDGTVKDASKEFPKSDTWYVGAFIHGQELNNQIDDFTVTWLEGDVVGPAAVDDLHATGSTANSVDLEWTSTGDNGVNGQATRLEVRYSTSPIDAGNFADATLVPNLPAPAPSGQKQRISVAGLNSFTTYYFALKIFDEVNNAGPLSNIVQAGTKSDGVAKQLAVISGCGQTGTVDDNLPEQLTARVTDANGLAVSGSPVQFAIVSGNGTVGGQQSITVNTDGNGEAKTRWKLGTVAGAQEVEIRANGLEGSPQACTATARAASPAKLIAASGEAQVVAIGQAAPSPLGALLTDDFDNPNRGRSVVFNIIAGGGYFLYGTTPAGKVFQALTDNDGQAFARVVASEVYGDTTYISAKWTNGSGARTLSANFFVAAAAPEVISEIKGNGQTAARGTALPESLMVQILDAVNLPVKDFPVTFRVFSGGGALGDNQTQVEVKTDDSGYARASWTLGGTAGEQQAEAEASFNGKSLRNAPLTFKATATIPTGIQADTAAVPQQFALHQNFPNPFNPETTIQFDLPEAGPVEMNVYDMNGRRVRQLLAATLPASSQRIVWNGRDDKGQPVNSGVYFLVLRAQRGGASGALVATMKVVLMK
jgi:hypothetical protein